MDQHRDVLATNGRQADKTQRQNSLHELHKLMDRLHAMRPEYQELMQCAQQNLQDALILKEELDAFVTRIEPSILST